ncbi:hypothetical protein INR49_024336 [Caranx melampygus]|nr:hypothetical protein INR49_024336 [Caranx melampygus]
MSYSPIPLTETPQTQAEVQRQDRPGDPSASPQFSGLAVQGEGRGVGGGERVGSAQGCRETMGNLLNSQVYTWGNGTSAQQLETQLKLIWSNWEKT